jgi:hypothetical protein
LDPKHATEGGPPVRPVSDTPTSVSLAKICLPDFISCCEMPGISALKLTALARFDSLTGKTWACLLKPWWSCRKCSRQPRRMRVAS